MKLNRLLAALLAWLFVSSCALAQGYQPMVPGNGPMIPTLSGGCSPYAAAGGACADLNYNLQNNQAWTVATGNVPVSSLLAVSRAGANATNLMPYSPVGYSFTTFAANTLRITLGLGILIEEGRVNELFFSTVPATQTTPSLAPGVYILTAYAGAGWLTMSTPGSGGATGCGTGIATIGNPITVTITVAGTCTVALSGTLACEQLELGSFGTSCIVTAGAIGTRPAELPQPIGVAGAIMLASQSAYFQTNSIPILANTPRLYAVTAGNPSINYTSTTSVGVLSSTGSGATATFGSGNMSGLVTTSFGFNSGGMSAIANSGSQGTAATAWDGTSGNPYLGNIASGNRALNGYMLSAAFSLGSSLVTAENPLPPGSSLLAGWGDSLTQGTGSTGGGDYLNDVSIALRRAAYNGGVPGQTSSQIVARQGGNPSQITITGNQIPASGGVAVTSYTQDICWFAGAHSVCSYPGTLSGVLGTLASDISGNYTFTRTASGSVVSSPANSPFVLSASLQYKTNLQYLEMGRNNYTSASQVEADYAYAYAYANYHAFVFSILTAETEGIGTPAYTAITALNSVLNSTYGSNYIDVTSPPTTLEMVALDYTPTSQDLTDIANGVIPTGMRAGDLLHLNNIGYSLWAMRVENATKAQYVCVLNRDLDPSSNDNTPMFLDKAA